MTTINGFFAEEVARPRRAAIFLSGSGSNAERILEQYSQNRPDSIEIVAIVTDRPKKSRAEEIANAYDLPMVAVDIREYYHAKGLKRISIATPEGRAVREDWTNELRRQLADCRVEFGIFAGFMPLCNLAADYPCLNVHPGDLTYEKDGERHLVGLYTVPIERAILEGLDYLRTSVIIVEPYEGSGKNMDAGPILGVSPEVPIDLRGHSLEELQAIADARPEKRPLKGYGDILEHIAEHNQERLKEGGDWVVFPPVVFEFAAGNFGEAEGQLFYKQQAVKTVEFGRDYAKPIK